MDWLNLLFLIPVLLVGHSLWDLAKDKRKKVQAKQGFAQAEASADGFAARLGLRYEPDSSLDQIGTIRGSIADRKIRMRIFKYRSVDVGWTGEAEYPIDLRVAKPRDRPEEDMVEFSTASPDFDTMFEQRYASQAIAGVFSRDPRLTEALTRFSKSGQYDLDSITIDEDGISCSLERSPSYDEEELSTLLSDIMALANQIEPSLSTAPRS